MSQDLLAFGSINRHYNTALPRKRSSSDSSVTVQCKVTGRTLGDEDSLALIHLPLYVFEEMKCTSGVLVELRTAKTPDRIVVAKAVVLQVDSMTSGASAEISPTLAWALGELSFRDVVLTVSLAAQIAPSVATEVRLARVVTAHSDGSANYATAIARHFMIPRLLRNGDIVPVAVLDLDAIACESSRNAERCSARDPLMTGMRVVYFQVTSISARSRGASSPSCGEATGTLFEVSRRHTTLVQQGSVHIIQPDRMLVADMLMQHIEQQLQYVYLKSEFTAFPDRELISTAFADALQVIFSFCELSLSGSVSCVARHHLQQLRLMVECAQVEDVKLLLDFVASKLGMDICAVSLRQLIGHTEVPSQQLIQAFALQLWNRSPCILLLSDVDEAFRSGSQQESVEEIDSRIAEALSQLWDLLRVQVDNSQDQPMCSPLWNHTTCAVVSIGVASSVQVLGPRTRALFAQEYELPSVTAAAAAECARQAWPGTELGASQRQKLNRTLVGRSVTDALTILSEACRLSGEQQPTDDDDFASFLQNFANNATQCWPECSPVDNLSTAVSSVLLREPKAMAKSGIPDVKWEDIGGLDYVRHEIVQTMEMPLKYPQLFGPNVPRRRAILLYGPPGTGKTLVAKAVATECDMNFMSIKGPELLDMYVGESERNVRVTFEEARKNAPCVLFFDELDSLAPKRGRGSDAGGVMDRVVSQLLSEMDALATNHDNSNDLASTAEDALQHAGIFVIAATNRPDLLDPSLLRPGRFDRKLYLGTNQTLESREGVLRAQTRKFSLHSSVDLTAVAEMLPVNTTGADVGSLTSQAYMSALNRKLQGLEAALQLRNDQDHYSTELSMATFLEGLDPSEFAVVVTHADLTEAARTLQPSVSLAELQHYERLREQFSDA